METNPKGLLTREEIMKKYLGHFEHFQTKDRVDYFKLVYRNEEGVIVLVVPNFTLYPLPTKNRKEEQ